MFPHVSLNTKSIQIETHLILGLFSLPETMQVLSGNPRLHSSRSHAQDRITHGDIRNDWLRPRETTAVLLKVKKYS